MITILKRLYTAWIGKYLCESCTYRYTTDKKLLDYYINKLSKGEVLTKEQWKKTNELAKREVLEI